MKVSLPALALLAASGASGQPATSQELEPRFDIGVRGVLLFSKGQPANDMIGEGIVVRWRMREAWHLGLALDSVTFDYETPNLILGIPSTTVVDGTNDLSRASVFLERRYDSERRWNWYWRAGIGLASADAPTVTGVRTDGGSFDIVTDAEDEVHVFAGGGVRRGLWEHWSFETTVTIEHHSTDYALVDRVSGASGSIGSQSPYGLAIGVSYGF
jgi:hypothetical protein